MMNILLCSIGSYTTASEIYTYKPGSIPKELNNDSKTIFSKIKSLNSKPNYRDKLKSSYGIWYVTRDIAGFVYAACTTNEYPYRHIYGLIESIKKIVKYSVPKTQEISQEDAIKKRGGDIDKLCEKYEDLKKVDKVRAAQSEVKGLENELQVGIQKLKSNKDVLQYLDDKAYRMKSYASYLASNASHVETMTFIKKWRMYIIVGVILAMILLISGVSIYLNTH